MKKSRVLTLGLACFLTAITAFGVAPITSGVDVFGDNYAGSSALANAPMGATNPSNAANLADGAQSLDRAQNEVLNLDPKTDETIYTTDSGIEIKQHNINLGTIGVQYFTLGSYNGTPVNWLVVCASSIGIGTDSTPAGAAVKADTAKQVIATGSVSSSLLENQILCISQYAFSSSRSINFTPHANITTTFNENNATYETYEATFKSTTDNYTDYYSSLNNPSSFVLSDSLAMGTTLGINGYYGSGSGKIVKNSNFSSNNVFSLSSTLYTTYVPSNYKISYLFTATSTATSIWTTNASLSGGVTSFCEYVISGSGTTFKPYKFETSGSGSAYASLANMILTTGTVGNVSNIATFSASTTKSSDSGYGTKILAGNVGYSAIFYPFTTTYSVSNTFTCAYRPAFIMQL